MLWIGDCCFCCGDAVMIMMCVCLKFKIVGMICPYIIENILKFKREGCTGRDS